MSDTTVVKLPDGKVLVIMTEKLAAELVAGLGLTRMFCYDLFSALFDAEVKSAEGQWRRGRTDTEEIHPYFWMERR